MKNGLDSVYVGKKLAKIRLHSNVSLDALPGSETLVRA